MGHAPLQEWTQFHLVIHSSIIFYNKIHSKDSLLEILSLRELNIKIIRVAILYYVKIPMELTVASSTLPIAEKKIWNVIKFPPVAAPTPLRLSKK
jgi:hypothetical protein